MSPSSVPVDPKLRLRLPRPRVDELQSPQRELTGEYPQALDVYRGLVIRIAGVEVWATEMMHLVVVHPDHDPVASADPGHGLDDADALGRFL